MATSTKTKEVLRKLEARKGAPHNESAPFRASPHGKVVDRKKIHDEGIVIQMHIPKGARIVTDTDTPYLILHRAMVGNICNIHLYADDLLDCRGRNVNAKLQILEKTYEDGFVRPYIDLDLTTKPATHTVHVFGRTSDFRGKESKVAFRHDVGESTIMVVGL